MIKNIFLVMVAVFLGVIYAVYFTDWFREPTMQIIPLARLDRTSKIPRSDDIKVSPAVFKLDQKYELTMIKVVIEAEMATNKFASPLWHLVSDGHSRATDTIVYGVACQANF